MFKFGTKKPQKSSAEIVKEIHEAFDTAADRLVQEAKDYIESLNSKAQNNEDIIKKAQRLRALGFSNSSPSKAGLRLETLNSQRAAQILDRSQVIRYVNHYTTKYPFLKFLTIPELDSICAKYNLIYAPVQFYTGDIPEKNLLDIEKASTLSGDERAPNKVMIKITKMYRYTDKHLDKILINKPFIYGGSSNYDEQNDVKWILAYARSKGWEGTYYSNYISERCEKTSINMSGLFIAAPKSEFEGLDSIVQENQFGYANSTKTIVDDPVVFRYCTGGIQVLTKWGPEASDPLLLNPLEN